MLEDTIDIIEFYMKGWLLQNFNANTLILIPTYLGANTIEKYRPIAMAKQQGNVTHFTN